MATVVILQCRFMLYLLFIFTYTDKKTHMHKQEMNLDSSFVNFPRTHTTDTMNIAFINIMDYVGHHSGGLFFLLQLICVPYSFYTYK